MSDDPSLLNERSATGMDILLAAARVFILVAGVLLILVGVVYAVQVFLTVGSLVKNPAALEGPVKSFEKVISADQLTLVVNGQAVPVGGAVALMLLFVWYLFWAWIPLAIVSVGARLVSTGAASHEARRERR